MNPEHRPSILIIGGGRAGASFAHHLYINDLPIISLVETSSSRLKYIRNKFNWPFLHKQLTPDLLDKSDIIIIAVRDDDIAEEARKLAELKKNWKNKIVIHLSGASSSSVLQPLQKKEAITASLHPIYSFSSKPDENLSLDQLWFTLEGAPRISDALATRLGLDMSRVIEVDYLQKLAVHIACVFYANFFSVLADMSQEILQNIPPLSGHNINTFKPLILSTIDNMIQNGIKNALTGPISRGDKETILHHLHFLDEHHPNLRKAYQFLGKRLAEISNLSQEDKKQIIERLDS